MRKELLATLLIVIAGPAAAQERNMECLGQAQQREIQDRMFNATLVGIFDLVPAQLETSRARAELRGAERDAASCQGFNCDAPRVALMQAQAKYDSTKLLADALHENLKTKLRNDMESIRAGYAPCNSPTGEVSQLRQRAYAYYKGEGVKQSTPLALEHFEKAARAGDAESAYDLGKIHEYGMGGVTADAARATSWYRAAAELGHRRGQFETSIAYYKGQGVAADRAEAAKWWTLATKPDDDVARSMMPSVESAKAKLTPEELAEGRRRAQAWKPR